MLVCVFVCASGTRDRGCSAHPVFPAPSNFEGERNCKPRAQCVARMRMCVFVGWVERSDTHQSRCEWRWVSLRSTHPTEQLKPKPIPRRLREGTIASIALANFARLPCSRRFFYDAPWDFHAHALTARNVSPGGSGRRPKGEINGGNDRRPSSVLRPRHLADPARHHHLRMCDSAVEFWAALEPWILHPADEPGIHLGPRR